MALKVKAKEKLQKIGKYADSYRYVMMPELYSTLTQDKVIKAWATEGHSVALPGLGTMRFGLRAKSCENVNEVKTSLIKSRRIIFTPDVDLKDELHNTSIQITCYDRNGEIVKRVTSSDPGTVEEPEGDTTGDNEGENENGSNSGTSGTSETGGDSNGGSNGGDNGDNNGGGDGPGSSGSMN